MKCGLKTFPLSVDLDDSVKLVEAEFGLKGYAVVIKLYQAIYSRGYYMKWDIDTELLFIRDYCLVEVGRNLVSEIVACCVRRGVFESTLFEKYQILTSKRIQETFLNATKRSTQVVFEKEYALPIVYTFIENANKNGKNANIFFKNADSFEERKEKESKVKKSKVKVYSARAREDDDFSVEEEATSSKQSATNSDITAFTRFIEKWHINTGALDNYSAGKISGIDWDAVSEWVAKSSYLQQQKAVTFYIQHAKEILDGKFFDYERPQKTKKPKSSEFPRDGNFWESDYAKQKREEYQNLMRRMHGDDGS